MGTPFYLTSPEVWISSDTQSLISSYNATQLTTVSVGSDKGIFLQFGIKLLGTITKVTFNYSVSSSATGAFTGSSDVATYQHNANSGGLELAYNHSGGVGKGDSFKSYNDVLYPHKWTNGYYLIGMYLYNVVNTKSAVFTVKSISFDVEYTPHSHTYDSSITKQPTCTEQGIKTFVCTNSECGHSYTEAITAKGHTPGSAATCTTAQTCTVCGATITAALGHSPGAAATCTTPQTCTRCGIQLAPALGHSFTNYVSDNNATCTADGTKTAKCDRCNATNTITDAGSALGHNYVETKVAPTEDSHGYTMYKCSRCGDSYIDPNSYTYLVRWYNEDGTALLETDPSVPHGTMPECSVTPTKQATAQYSYTHAGWAISPTAESTTALTAVVANIKYYARFTASTNTYRVTWKDDNGDVLETDLSVPYGAPPDYNGATPTKASTAQYDYTFLGWSAEVFEGYREEDDLPEVTGTIVYTAVYLPKVRAYNFDVVTYDCEVSVMFDYATNVPGKYNYGTIFTVSVKPNFGYNAYKIALYEGSSIYPTEYDGDELTFILTDDTTVVCTCKRALVPIYISAEQQVKDVYVVPAIGTVVYIVDGALPVLEATMDSVDGLHFDVINTSIDISKYSDYVYYAIEQLYVNDAQGNSIRVW